MWTRHRFHNTNMGHLKSAPGQLDGIRVTRPMCRRRRGLEVVLYRPILQWGPPLDEGLCVRWTGLHFFFSFELSYLKAAKKANLAGAPEIGYKNLLRSALSLCRMVLRGLERPAAPPH